MKKIVLGLAGFIILLSIGLNVYLHQRISENTGPDPVPMEEPENIRMDAAGKDISKKGAEVKKNDMKVLIKLEEELDAAEEAVDMVNEQLSEELAKKEAFKEARSQLQKIINSDPSFRESIKNARLQTIDSDYALLYDRLDLSPEELEQFRNIVGTWRIDHMDNTVPLILSAVTDAEKEEAYRQRELRRDKYKEQYIELMGEEKYNIYNDFRMSSFDRDTLDRFVQMLPAEKRIDDDLMLEIIDRMSEARTYVEKKMGFYDLIRFPSDNRADTAELEADMAEQVYEKYMEIGNEMLSPEQAEQYKAYIAQERERYLSQIKMSSF